MRKVIISCLFLLQVFVLQASVIDTIKVYSQSMKKNVSALVVIPNGYSESKTQYPVVYMLHGFSDSYKNGWVSHIKATANYADNYKMILVLPDGGFSSWYFDSPIDSSIRYETFVSKELINYIDSHYNSIKTREGRAITGNSMGGHGAFYLSFKHKDIFGAAGSTSGGLDIRPFPNNWDIAKRLGSFTEYRNNWESNTVINLIPLLKPNSLAIIFDCGSEDFFYKVNCEFHDKLLALKIPHEFISRPGNHGWEYWQISIQSHMLFFNNYFSKLNR